jgi:hypothetical protein
MRTMLYHPPGLRLMGDVTVILFWKLARVVEWNGLENRHTGNGIWGSNP